MYTEHHWIIIIYLPQPSQGENAKNYLFISIHEERNKLSRSVMIDKFWNEAAVATIEPAPRHVVEFFKMKH